jgi:hypothetical protein
MSRLKHPFNQTFSRNIKYVAFTASNNASRNPEYGDVSANALERNPSSIFKHQNKVWTIEEYLVVFAPVNIWATGDTSTVHNVSWLHTLNVGKDRLAVLQAGSAELILCSLQSMMTVFSVRVQCNNMQGHKEGNIVMTQENLVDSKRA